MLSSKKTEPLTLIPMQWWLTLAIKVRAAVKITGIYSGCRSTGGFVRFPISFVMEVATLAIAAGHLHLEAEEEAADLRRRVRKIRILMRRRRARRRALLASLCQLVSCV